MVSGIPLVLGRGISLLPPYINTQPTSYHPFSPYVTYIYIYTCISLFMYVSLSLSLSLWLYIYTYLTTLSSFRGICLYIYIYLYQKPILLLKGALRWPMKRGPPPGADPGAHEPRGRGRGLRGAPRPRGAEDREPWADPKRRSLVGFQ